MSLKKYSSGEERAHSGSQRQNETNGWSCWEVSFVSVSADPLGLLLPCGTRAQRSVCFGKGVGESGLTACRYL